MKYSVKNFFESIILNIKIFLFCLLYMGMLRWLFILSLGDSSGSPFSIFNLAQVFWIGFLYDMKLSFMLFCFLVLFSSVPVFFVLPRVSGFFQKIILNGFIFLTLLFTAATREFFLEYNNTFNIRIFDGLHDDHLAIFKTIMSSYHLIEYITFILFATILYAIWGHPFVMKALQKSMIRKCHPFLNSRLALTIVLFIFTTLSFSFAFGPLEADDKNAMRFHSKVLNASVMPGPIALYKATYEYRLKMRSYDKNLYQVSDVVDALIDISGGAKVEELDSHFLKVSSGNYLLPEKPLHVFVFLMERYDSWPLLPKYNSLKVTEGLKAMIEKGMYFKSFLPASTTTMPSVQTIVLGLPFIGLNAQHFTEKIYPGAIAGQMAALGYKTRFFYGGYLNWQQIGLVASSQGFEQVFGAGEKIKKYVQRNEWGIDDVSLFNYISDVVYSDSAPSFNLILTSTNHPPYDLRLENYNAPLEKIGNAIEKLNFSNNSKETNINRMGHLWYSDHALASFVETMSKKYPNSLFVITGDHFSRAHVHLETSLYEQSSVPLVLYGPKSLQNIQYNELQPGSHLDIAPTLVELLAPKGFQYHSLGDSLLGIDPQPFSFGSEDVILTKSAIFKLNSPETGQSLDGQNQNMPPETKQYQSYVKSMKVVTWWRMMHGNNILKLRYDYEQTN